MCIDLNAPQKPYLVAMAQLEVQCQQLQQHEHKALGIGFHSNQSNTSTLRSFTPSPVSPYSLVLQLEPLLQF
jgi:hypothetical protein